MIPKSLEDFRNLFKKYYLIIRNGLISTGSDINNIWSLEDTIYIWLISDYVNHYNPSIDQETTLSRIKMMYKDNITTVWHISYMLNKEIPGLNLSWDNIPKKMPGFDQLIKTGIIPENNWYYDGTILKNCFIIWKLWNMNIPGIDDIESEEFAKAFEYYIHYILNIISGPEKELDPSTMRDYFSGGKNILYEQPFGRIKFFEKIFEQIVYFYGKWCIVKNLPVEEYLFMNKLTDEELPEDKSRIYVQGKLLYVDHICSKRKKTHNKICVDMYEIYIVTNTGKIFSTKVHIPNKPEKKEKRKKKTFSQKDLMNKPIGTRIHMSGKIRNKMGYPTNIYWNNKVYELVPCELENARFLLIE